MVPLAWVAVGILVVAGVAVAGTAAYYELKPGASRSGAAGNSTGGTPSTVTLTDDLGRKVTVPYDPSRVVVLGPSIMDSVYRLGLRSHVVGVDCYSPAFGGLASDYSSDQIALWNLSDRMCVQTSPSFEYEQLLNLTPQLVLATTIVSVAAVESITATYHIPVVMLQPPTLGDILIDETLLGQIFNAASAASTLNLELQGVLANASAVQANLTAQGTPYPTVLVTYSTDSSGYWTFGPGTFGESLIELASATSISANSTLPYPELSGEQVLASNPEFLVYGVGFGLTESSYTTAPLWSDLGAVKDGHLVGIDANYLTEPGPTMILDGLPALLVAFGHPASPAS